MKSFGKKAWLLPQPVLIIGTYNENGVSNAMNAAWAGQWDAHEIMISMGSHATTENLNHCGEFTVAFATKETMVASDYVGIVSAKNESNKMEKTGWTAVKAQNVNAPVFTDFPLTMECRIKEKIEESETGYYIVAEIVNIVCNEEYLAEDGKPDLGVSAKKRPKKLVSRYNLLYYSQKLFNDKKSAFIAAQITQLKRVGRMVANDGFAKTVNGTL